jgi:spermidine synthase
VAWFQLLQLTIGSTAVSLAVLLGSFMGGLCLGSLALPKLISSRQHPFRVYAALELGIGLIGIGIVFGLPWVGRLYLLAGGGITGALIRGAVCAACLLPPTMLMGATLPAVARWVEATPQGVSWLGFFYGANTVGAVFGCLLSAFYLLRLFDPVVATLTAASLNAVLFLIALGLAALLPYEAPEEVGIPVSSGRERSPWAIYAAIGLSGMCALGAEVVWTRLLSLMLGGTVYTFALILAVFLSGLGTGSYLGAAAARVAPRPRKAFGWCQLMLTGAVAWAAVMTAKFLPYWPVDTSIASIPWSTFQLDLARCFWAVFPATLLWGASFPLALAAASTEKQDPGKLVAGIYAANTIGAIAGGIAFSVFLIPWIGTQLSQRLLAGGAAAAGILLLLTSDPLDREVNTRSGHHKAAARLNGVLSAAAVSAAAVLLVWSIPRSPWELIAFGRRMPTKIDRTSPLYVGEGRNASIAVTQDKSGDRNFHVSGKVVASSHHNDMRLQKMLGHIPSMLHDRPRSVLVVGCGAGVTAGTFLQYPDVERVVICEIEPLIPPAASEYFGIQNAFVMEDARVEVIIDDARHFVLKTREKFDIITSDPIHPWVKGSAALYTQEYFELCLKHLNPGGLITQWVPLYESDREVVRSEIATFFAVFHEGTIWSNDLLLGLGYDLVLLGRQGPLRIDVDRLVKRFGQQDYASAVQSLSDVGFNSAIGMLSAYTGRAPDLQPWLEGAEINRDRSLRLQYLAGMALNSRKSQGIFAELMDYFRFPEDMLISSEASRRELRKYFDLEGKLP